MNKNTLKILFDWRTFLTVLCLFTAQLFGLCQFTVQEDMHHFDLSNH